MLTTTLWTIGTGWETEVAAILATPLGAVLFFGLGMVIIWTVTPLFVKGVKYIRRASK